MFDYVLWGNTLHTYLVFVSVIVGGWVAVWIVQHIVVSRLAAWAQRTTTTFDDFIIQIIKQIAVPLFYFGVIYISLNMLVVHPSIMRVLRVVGMGLVIISLARLVTQTFQYFFMLYWHKRGSDELLDRSMKGILVLVDFLIWTLAVVFFLDNLGFKISAIIAGLGIGGVAVALAAQAVLGDLFSYFSIIFDRPFEIGDFIIIGDCMGTVEYIGIKTTRISSLSGEQIIFSNSDLTNSRVRNYKRMSQRRVLFRLGVTYETSLEKTKELPNLLKDIISSVPDTRFDRAHFFSYGDFSLIYEVVYYVVGSEYNKYMDIQQDINFKIKQAFESRGIEFAYPTQTLVIQKQAT